MMTTQTLTNKVTNVPIYRKLEFLTHTPTPLAQLMDTPNLNIVQEHHKV